MVDRTFIGASLVLDGEITGEDPVHIAGHVMGRVGSTRAVVVEPKGVVQADITCSTAEVAGEVEGAIDAEGRVTVQSGGRIRGDVRADRLVAADGARIVGHVDADDRSE